MLIEAVIDNNSYDELALLRLVPQNIFSTKKHVEICGGLAEVQNQFSNEDLVVFKNLLCTRSTFAKCITAIYFLSLSGKYELKQIKVLDIYFKFINNMFKCEVFSIKKTNAYRLINYSSKLTITAKYITHSLYFFIGIFVNPKFFKNNSYLRAWVEVSENIHGKDRFRNSTIIFYPFPYKLKRQLSFIKYCIKQKYQIGFSGISYSFIDLIKLLTNMSDKNIVKFEINGYKKHVDLLLKKQITHYFTEDDYDASAFIIANKLIHSGVTCTNTAHGVNQINPFIGASVFEALTIPQVEHFSSFKFNKNISFKFQGKKITNKSCLFKNEFGKINFIFIHGNFKENEMIYEHNLQAFALKKIVNYINEENFYIKYHPNGTFRENLKINEIKNNSELDDIENKCFITLNSTSYFHFGESGVFIFIGDDLANPFNIIGKNVPFYKTNELHDMIKYYSNYLNFLTGFENQIKHLNLSRQD
jgi:hypothetical protein